MPFIGQQPITGAYSKLDAITTSATATYNLLLDGSAYSPASANHLLVSLNGVMQAPQDSFTVSGSTIIFDSALTSSDSIDFIMALGDVLNVGVPSDGTITAGKIASGAVTAGKIGSGAVTDAKLASTLDLSGKTVSNFTNPNGYNLLVTRTDTSNVDYSGNVEILDFSSYINDYHTFWFSINVDATGADGNQHLYLRTHNASGTGLEMAMIMNGYNNSGSSNTPQVGANASYFRFAYRHYKQMAATVTGYIHNHPNTGAQNATMQLQSNWQFAGSGAAFANGSIRVTSSDKIGKLGVNFDAGDAGGGDSGSTNHNCRIVAEVYGVR